MASANPVRRTALVTGFAFAVVTGVVAVGAYGQRNDSVTVAVSDSRPTDTAPDATETGSDGTGPVGSTAATLTPPPTTVAPAAADSVVDTTVGTSTSTPRATTTGVSARSSTTSAGTATTTTVLSGPVCSAIDGSSPRTAAFRAAPPVCTDERATYTAVMETSEGTIKIALDRKNAPKTVNNFVFLSRFHYYDGLTIHRVVPGFIMQGGDPLANSNGGPGYTFADELPGKDGYDIGAVAMANSGVDTNGSQFFIVTGPTGQALKGTYSTFGKVTGGLSVLKAIDALGRPPGDNAVEFPPLRTITILSVKITAVGERESRIPGYSGTGSVSTTTTVG